MYDAAQGVHSVAHQTPGGSRFATRLVWLSRSLAPQAFAPGGGEVKISRGAVYKPCPPHP